MALMADCRSGGRVSPKLGPSKNHFISREKAAAWYLQNINKYFTLLFLLSHFKFSILIMYKSDRAHLIFWARGRPAPSSPFFFHSLTVPGPPLLLIGFHFFQSCITCDVCITPPNSQPIAWALERSSGNGGLFI